MINPNSLANLKPFKPGESGNPGGMPVGIRSNLNKKFLVALSQEFEKSGSEAIERVAKEDPATFIKVLAAILPKEMEIRRPLDDMTDEQLRASVDALQRYLSAQGNAEGNGTEGCSESDKGLQTIQ
jgi:hypothetical protein